MVDFLTEEDGEKIAKTIEKITYAIKKHDLAIKKGSLLSLIKVKEITSIDFEIDEYPVSQINRLLKENWKLLALNQYTKTVNEKQEWGSIAYLGKFD